MVEILINVPFSDKYTGELYKADGKPIVITKERATEIQNFNKGFITVLKEVAAEGAKEEENASNTTEEASVPVKEEKTKAKTTKAK